MNRISRIRKSALLAASALTLVVAASSGAQAQTARPNCVNTVQGGVTSSFVPFASGGSVSSLISVLNTTNTAFLTQSSAFIGSPANPQPNEMGGGIWARGIGGRIDTGNYGVTGIGGGGAGGGGCLWRGAGSKHVDKTRRTTVKGDNEDGVAYSPKCDDS